MTSVPDAWDDDWVKVADKPGTSSTEPVPAPKVTKAEKRAKHAEQQKRLWNTAENPSRKMWLETNGVDVPFQQPHAQPVQLLSRRPPPSIARRNLAGAVGQLSLDDDEDSEDERRKKLDSDLEERTRQAKVQREEKQRLYAEARERIMGSSASSPVPNSRESSQARDRRQRGNKSSGTRRSQPESPAEQSLASSSTTNQLLFDPEDMGRRLAPKRESSNTPKEDQPLRQPRGPTQGGFGFATRGA